MANLGAGAIMETRTTTKSRERSLGKQMHATIRPNESRGATVTTDELVQLGRKIAANLSRTQGFVSFLILSSLPELNSLSAQQDQMLATVSIFEDQPSLERADRLLAAPLKERLAAQCPKRVEIT